MGFCVAPGVVEVVEVVVGVVFSGEKDGDTCTKKVYKPATSQTNQLNQRPDKNKFNIYYQGVQYTLFFVVNFFSAFFWAKFTLFALMLLI